MKMKWKVFVLIIALGLMLAACSNNTDDSVGTLEPSLSTEEMVDEMLKVGEQPELMALDAEEVDDFYGLDVDNLEEYSVRIPMMNVKTNEIAIIKVKDEKDVEEIENAVEQRAEDVQKQFENYLPDQYENAKNYKLKTKGKYVLFIISEDADTLVDVYERFFEEE